MRSASEDSHTGGMSPISVGRIEISAVDGHVHISVGDQVVDLDPRACDDLVHALLEAQEGTR